MSTMFRLFSISSETTKNRRKHLELKHWTISATAEALRTSRYDNIVIDNRQSDLGRDILHTTVHENNPKYQMETIESEDDYCILDKVIECDKSVCFLTDYDRIKFNKPQHLTAAVNKYDTLRTLHSKSSN